MRNLTDLDKLAPLAHMITCLTFCSLPKDGDVDDTPIEHQEYQLNQLNLDQLNLDQLNLDQLNLDQLNLDQLDQMGLVTPLNHV